MRIIRFFEKNIIILLLSDHINLGSKLDYPGVLHIRIYTNPISVNLYWQLPSSSTIYDLKHL